MKSRYLLILPIIAVLHGQSYASTVSTFDVLVATETLTVIGTTTFQGNAFNVGGSSLVVYQGNVGIGTTTPSALLHLVSGPIQGNGAQFKWIASSGSLRSGEASGNSWDPANIGLFSIAFGFNGLAPGSYTTVSGGHNNSANAGYSTIGGGDTNTTNGGDSVVCGGAGNQTSSNYSAVVGGASNSAFGAYAFVGGGNLDMANGDYVTIGGGYNNSADAGGVVCGGGYDGSQKLGNNAGGGASAVVGGLNNIITGSSAYSFIGGGKNNLISNGARSTIAGGEANTISGSFATIPGGNQNTASGDYSFAAGRRSSATAQGSFVWSDSQNLPFVSNNSDEFKARAQGGFVFYSTWAAPTVIVSSGSLLISTSASAATAIPNIFVSSTTGNVGIGTANPQAALDVNGSAQFGSGTAKSSFTSTGLLYLTASGIHWADGTTSTTAAAGSSFVAISTCGYQINQGSFIGNSTFQSVSGSSLTWTSQGGYPRISMKFHFLAWNNNDIICFKALIDGGSSGSRTQCWESIQPPSGGSQGDANLDFRMNTLLTARSHTIHLDFNTTNSNGVKMPQYLSGEDGSQLCVYDNQ